MKTIAIIDYGMGNLRSVYKALKLISSNHRVLITNKANILDEADKLVLPGQGAILASMNYINKANLLKSIKKNSQIKPFLGICLGLQLLFEKSEENNSVKAMNILAGSSKYLKEKSDFPTPHMGWNQVNIVKEHPLWYGIDNLSFFYHMHSYYVEPKDKSIIASYTNYSKEITTAICHNFLFAVQFHPEKSQSVGLQFLKNFIQWQ